MDAEQFSSLLKAIAESNINLAEFTSTKKESPDQHEKVTFYSNFKCFNSSIDTFIQYEQ